MALGIVFIMSNPENELLNNLLYSALCLCFNRGEQYLTMRQAILRGFAPSEQLCRHYISLLIRSKQISAQLEKRKQRHRPHSSKKRELVIIRPEITNCGLSKWLLDLNTSEKSLIKKSKECDQLLYELTKDVEAGECIEYAKFYAKMNNLTIYNMNPFEPKLQILLIELDMRQVFMLIWRTIKELSNEDKCHSIHFSELMETASDFYSEYINRQHKIKSYKIPKSLRRSKLSTLLSTVYNKYKQNPDPYN